MRRTRKAGCGEAAVRPEAIIITDFDCKHAFSIINLNIFYAHDAPFSIKCNTPSRKLSLSASVAAASALATRSCA